MPLVIQNKILSRRDFCLGNMINFHTTKPEHMVDILLHKSAAWKGSVKIQNPFSSQIFHPSWHMRYHKDSKTRRQKFWLFKGNKFITHGSCGVCVLTHISTHTHTHTDIYIYRHALILQTS